MVTPHLSTFPPSEHHLPGGQLAHTSSAPLPLEGLLGQKAPKLHSACVEAFTAVSLRAVFPSVAFRAYTELSASILLQEGQQHSTAPASRQCGVRGSTGSRSKNQGVRQKVDRVTVKRINCQFALPLQNKNHLRLRSGFLESTPTDFFLKSRQNSSQLNASISSTSHKCLCQWHMPQKHLLLLRICCHALSHPKSNSKQL